jgi:hypothetical protein
MGLAQKRMDQQQMPSVEQLHAMIRQRIDFPEFKSLYDKYGELSPGKVKRDHYQTFMQDCLKAIVIAKNRIDVEKMPEAPAGKIRTCRLGAGMSFYTFDARLCSPQLGIEVAVFNSIEGCERVKQWFANYKNLPNLPTYLGSCNDLPKFKTHLKTLEEFKSKGFKGFDDLSESERKTNNVFCIIFDPVGNRPGMTWESLSILTAEKVTPVLN